MNLLLSILINFSFALTVPKLTGPIVDQMRIFSPSESSQIGNALKSIEKDGVIQLQVLIVKDLEGEPIENYSIAVVDQWKIGKEKTDNGILFVIAPNDRQVRIEVGTGLEGTLTDLETGRIIRQILPYFKQNRYRDGIVVGINSILSHFNNEAVQPPPSRIKQYQNTDFIFIVIFICLFIPLAIARNWLVRKGIIVATSNRSRHYGGSSRGGFGRIGGGGWSGGGGGFSGGGASGRW